MSDAKLRNLGAELSQSVALLYANGATPDDAAVEGAIGTHVAAAMESGAPPREILQSLMLTSISVMGAIAGASGDLAKIQDQIARCFLSALSVERLDPSSAAASVASRLGPTEAERWRQHVDASFAYFPENQAMRTPEEAAHFEAVCARFGIDDRKGMPSAVSNVKARSPELHALLSKFEEPLGFFWIQGFSSARPAADVLFFSPASRIVADWGRAAKARTLFVTAEFLQSSADVASRLLLERILERSSLDEVRNGAAVNLNDALRDFEKEREAMASGVAKLLSRIDGLLEPDLDALVAKAPFRQGHGTYDGLMQLQQGHGYVFESGLFLGQDARLHRNGEDLGRVEYLERYENHEHRGIIVEKDGERQFLVCFGEKEGYRALTASEKEELRGMRAMLRADLEALQSLLDEACVIAAIPSRKLDIAVPEVSHAA